MYGRITSSDGESENSSNVIEMETLSEESSLPSVPVNLSDKKSKEQITLIKILLDFLQVTMARLPSVGCYYGALQLFLRENKENLLLGSDIAMLNNFSNILRESTRYVNNATSEVDDGEHIEELRKIFLTAHIIAIPATTIVWIAGQSYVLLLPSMGRSKVVYEQLKWVPTKFVGNTFIIQMFNGVINFSYGCNRLGVITVGFPVGAAVVIASYEGIRRLNSNVTGFMLANVFQNLAIVICYIIYYMRYNQEKLLPFLFNVREWWPALKKGLELMKMGIQPASILAIQLLANGFNTYMMGSDIELSAFNAVSSFLPIANTLGAAYEARVSSHAMKLVKNFEAAPEQLSKELKHLMMYAVLVGNFLPSIFTLAVNFFGSQIVSVLVEPSADEENVTIRKKAESLLPIVGAVCMLRMVLAACYGMTISFTKSEDPFYQKQNRNATITIITMAILSTLIGVGLNFGLEMGAYGFWLAAAITMTVSCISLCHIALRSIHHATEVTTLFQQTPEITQTNFGLWPTNPSSTLAHRLLDCASNTFIKPFSSINYNKV